MILFLIFFIIIAFKIHFIKTKNLILRDIIYYKSFFLRNLAFIYINHYKTLLKLYITEKNIFYFSFI